MSRSSARCFRSSWWALVALLIFSGSVRAGSSALAAVPSWDGNVRTDGSLRAMFHDGQTGAVVSFDDLLPNEALYAVGALANLSGEVTIIAGRAYLAYPEGQSVRVETSTRPRGDAALLASSRVPSWNRVRIATAIPFEQLEDAIAELAQAAGLDPDESFPFLLEGRFEELRWHVIDGERLRSQEGSHQDHLAAAIRGEVDGGPAVLVGFFSKHDEGVFTHMGSKTHLHCVVENPLVSGHVDHVVVPEGTILGLPIKKGPGK